MKRGLIAAVAAALVLAGCGSSTDEAETESESDTESQTAEVEGSLTVFAAASLTDVFDAGIADLEEQYPDLSINASYAGSSDLAAQIIEGAPADVFASADLANMETVVSDGAATDSEIFATNTLVIAVAEGNPEGIEGLEDLTSEEIVSVRCAPQVPCGSATDRLLDLQGLSIPAVSEENSVTAVLGAVAAGQADAGLVYRTDIARADGVEAIEAERSDEVINEYPIAVLTDAANPDAAQVFVEYFISGPGADLLADAGFGQP